MGFNFDSGVGQFLAVGWSDGVVRLMGLENNKAAHHIEVCSRTSDAKITYIGWACSQIATRSTNTLTSRLKGEDADEWRALHGGGATIDLPRELTFLEIETALPKISPLPGSSAGNG